MSFRQGARQFFERRGAPAWTNPYVTDGLVAMWDGEWNAGGGVHDANATVWRDLSGYGYDLSLPSSFSAGLDYMLASAAYGAVLRRPQSVYEAIVASGGYTIDVAFDASGAYGGVLATVGNENQISVFQRTRVSCVASNKYNGSGTNQTLAYSMVGSSDANTWCLRVVLGTSTEIYKNGGYNNGGMAGGIAGLQYPQYVGLGVGSSYPNANNGASGGKYHCVRLYSRALAAAEIAANYAIDKARFSLP